MRILLLSAYSAQSHQQWRDGLVRMFPDAKWSVLELPPRHFAWRMRGSPLYWSIEQCELLEQPFDLLIATSMVDLSTLRGLVPNLARIPSLLYFHENQFAYPHNPDKQSLLEAQMVSLYAALAADKLCFNSRYNLDTFLSGVETLLSRFPDYTPEGVAAGLAEKAEVLPVPYDVYWSGTPSPPCWPGQQRHSIDQMLRLVWVGRLEHDKGPEQLLSTLSQLERRQVDYELAIIGQPFRTTPAVFAEIEEKFHHRLCHFGFVPDHQGYRALLSSADVVLSTARHEFQGLAVMEAVASGCLPALPARMAYSEIYAQEYCYRASHHDAGGACEEEGNAAADLILNLRDQLVRGELPAADVSAYTSAALTPRYQRSIHALLATAG